MLGLKMLCSTFLSNFFFAFRCHIICWRFIVCAVCVHFRFEVIQTSCDNYVHFILSNWVFHSDDGNLVSELTEWKNANAFWEIIFLPVHQKYIFLRILPMPYFHISVFGVYCKLWKKKKTTFFYAFNSSTLFMFPNFNFILNKSLHIILWSLCHHMFCFFFTYFTILFLFSLVQAVRVCSIYLVSHNSVNAKGKQFCYLQMKKNWK